MRAATIALVLLVLRTIAAASPGATGAATGSAAARGAGASGGNRGLDESHRGGGDSAADDPAGEDLELAGARQPVRGPSIGAVLAAAYTTAGLDRDPGRGWIRRARLAGLVPWVTVRTARDTSWQDPQSEVGHSTALEVRATWRLDRLLFDSRELQVAALEAARRRERRRLANRVIRSYFTWRRAAGTADTGDDRTTPRVAEAIAELDALTEGWFSDELARRKRAAEAAPAPRAVP